MTKTQYTSAALIALLLVASSGLGGCGIYKINVQQGNFLDDDKIAELKVGMTRRQVEYLLGSPTIKDSFHANRWDYVFYFRNGRNDKVTKRNLVVIFDGDTVAELQLPDDFEGSA